MAAYDEMGNYTGYDDGYDMGGYPAVEPVSPQQTPISYDPFGNPVYNEEEERRRREEELRQIEEYKKQQEALGSEVSHKQEVTTYADGSQTVTTKREVPAGQQQRIQPVPPQSPEQARFNQQQYNQSIAQQESGGRQDIGYHNQQLSSAYGPYGITAGAYEDARRANPNLPADIRQATPEQMTQAQNAVTQNNARYLQSYGVPVTNNTLQAAHFLGAKGLSDYLKTGYISPAAAQANGGVERVKQIVNARLKGQTAPASGATQLAPGETAGVPTGAPQMQPVAPPKPAAMVETPMGTAEPATTVQAPRMAPNSYDEFGTPVYSPEQAKLDAALKTYESIQNDPKALMNFEGPDWMQNNAKMRAADLLSNQRDEQRAMESIQKADPKDLARTMMREPTDRWEIIKKSAMFRLLGAKGLADAELAKISTPVEKYIQGADGKPYLMKQNAAGEFTEGYNAETGQKLTDKELVTVGAGVQAVKGAQTHTGKMQDITTGEVYYERTTPQGIQLVSPSGKIYKGADNNLRPFGIGSDIATKNQIQLNELQNKLEFAGPHASAAEREKIIAESEAKYGPLPEEYKRQVRAAQPLPAGVATGTPIAGAPGAAPIAQPAAAGMQPVAPGPAPAAQPAPVAVQPAVPGAPTTAGLTPAQREQQTKLGTAQGEANIAVGKAEQTEYVEKTKPAVGQTASDGQSVANARRQQLDIIKRNPSIVNIMNGQGTTYDQARRIMINAVSGAYGAEDRQQLAQDLGKVMNKLTEAEQGALTEFVNLNTVVNSKTLRANAGPGAVSDAEQRANKEANIGNVDSIPVYAAMAGLNRSQFTGDLAASKQAFMDAHPEFKTTSQFNSAWQKEEALRLREYQAIAKARFDVMGRAPAPSAGPEAIAAYRDRVFRAFEAYPAPQYDVNSGKWNYQTANARRAAMAAVLGQ
jgi:hypothetical protein